MIRHGILDSSRSKAVAGPSYPTSGLIIEYKLEQNVNDTSGQGFDGVAVSQSYTASGKVGYAASYTGSATNYITVDPCICNYINGASKPEFTVACWIYPTTLDTYNQVHGNWYSGNDEIHGIHLQSNGQIQCYREAGGGLTYLLSLTSAGDIQTNKWHLVTSGFNAGRLWMKVWKDSGMFRDVSAAADYATTSTQTYYLGRRGNASTIPFKGYIDQFRFYNRSLSNDELAQLWNNGNGI